MPERKRFALKAVLLAFITLSLAGQAGAAGFNQFVGFGDSTFDSGYFRYNTTGSAANDQAMAAAVAQGASGAYVGPGIMNSTMLAGRFGLSAAPVGAGGTNYANGGAFSAPLSVNPGGPYLSGVSFPTNVSSNQQIQNYLASTGGVANPNALYVLKTSDNDLQFQRAMTPAWVAANPNFLPNLALAEAQTVSALQAAGARTIMVPNSYNYAVFAGLGGAIAPENTGLYATSLQYGYERWSSLSAVGVRFIPADVDSLMRYVVQHPTMFGFTPTSVLSANTLSPSLTPLLVTNNDVTPAQLQTNLFIGANGVHFTTAGQKIESDYYYSLLNAPAQMSLIPENEVQIGLARAATIQGQIDLSGQHRGPTGVNVWASGGTSTLSLKNAPGFTDSSGNPFAGSVGADYQFAWGGILGAAFTMGGQTQNFSTGGRFDQTDQAVSLYGAYRYGPVWGNAVASYGWFQDNIARQVTLGAMIDQNSANTNGNSLSLALRAGGDSKLGPVTTGPVAGLVLQQVRLKGFTETGFTGVTALSYGGQAIGSAVSQLGWRVLVDVGRFQPFVEAKWNHEFYNQTTLVKAGITTAVAAPYKIDAAPVASDWSSASIGTSFKVSDRVLLRISGSAMLYNPQVVNYGGEVGLNISF